MTDDHRNEAMEPRGIAFWGGVLTFGLIAAIGFRIAISAWDGMIFVSDLKLKGKAGRVPAAIRKDLDLSRLNGAELLTASQKRLLTAARVIHDKDGLGLEFGQFIIRAEDGQRQLSCDYYDRVQVRLVADGIAMSGEKPEFVIDAPCATSTDLSKTEPIRIPASEITAAPPVDGDAAFASIAATSFRFRNMMNQWPERWAVTEVKLYREADPGRNVQVDQEDMREFSHRPLIVTFPGH